MESLASQNVSTYGTSPRPEQARYYISIELTSHCNLHCPSCPRDEVIQKAKHMEWENFTRIIDEYEKIPNHLNQIYLGGLGEPLLYKNIFEAIHYIREKNIKVGLNTNLTYLNETWVEKILNSDLTSITLSLNGYSEKSYEAITGNKSQDKVVQNALLLLKRKKEKGLKNPEIHLQLLECQHTQDEIEDFKNFWRPHMSANDRFFIRPLENQGGQIDLEFPIQHNPLLLMDNRYPCMYVWNFFAIDVDGFIYPCCKGFLMNSIRNSQTSKLKLAHIKDVELNQLIQSDRLNQIRDGQLQSNYKIMPECLSCDSFKCYPKETFKKVGSQFEFV